jgi:hypothetical protein
MRRRSTSPLTLDDVRESGQLAFLCSFGDNLVYLRGTVYSVPNQTDGHDVEELVRHPDSYPVTAGAGIDFGWYHVDGCSCEFCRPPSSEDGTTSDITSRIS